MDSCTARQGHAERLGDQRHRTGCAHHGAGSGGHRKPAFDLFDLRRIDPAGPVFRPEGAAIRCVEPLAARWRASRRTSPSDELDGRNAAPRPRPSIAPASVFVAAADQHHRVHRLGEDHLLDVHRHQVAIDEAGRDSGTLRRARQSERHAARAGRQNAARHRLDEIGHQAMAIVEARRRHQRRRDHRLV